MCLLYSRIKRAARRTNTVGNGREGGLFAGFKMTTSAAGGSAGFGQLLGRRPLSTASQTITTPEDGTFQLSMLMLYCVCVLAHMPWLLLCVNLGESLEESSTGSVSSNGGSEYLVQLRALNVGVSQWISSHVEKNPHVDLTPIFRDYEKHLKTIDLKVYQCSILHTVHVH